MTNNYTDKLEELGEIMGALRHRINNNPDTSNYISDEDTEAFGAAITSITALINRDYILKSEVLSAIDECLPDKVIEKHPDGTETVAINVANQTIKTKLGLEK
jgi:hypothetical protein